MAKLERFKMNTSSPADQKRSSSGWIAFPDWGPNQHWQTPALEGITFLTGWGRWAREPFQNPDPKKGQPQNTETYQYGDLKKGTGGKKGLVLRHWMVENNGLSPIGGNPIGKKEKAEGNRWANVGYWATRQSEGVSCGNTSHRGHQRF